ncbi:MAG: thiamine diphosphokinase [Bacteroidales bacterium]
MAVKTGDRIMNLADSRIVIVADGAFPRHRVPLAALDEADFIVCCDGAAASLVEYGLEPAVIIGDLDSLEPTLAARFSDRLVKESDQETNDLTKAVRWCVSRGAKGVTIVGATGKREDHTLGNISLLADYGKIVRVKMLTDTGTMFPVYGDCDQVRDRQKGQISPEARKSSISTNPGQRISVVSLDSNTRLTATGLEYPIEDLLLESWWTATLNTATGTRVTLTFTSARLIIYLGHV